MIRCACRLLVVVALFAVAPGVAHASVASRSGGQISITANPGEANDIRFTVSCCFYSAQVTDTAGITAAGECTQTSATAVDCGATDGKPDVTVSLGDGNDSFVADELFNIGSFTVDGGDGNDKI